MENQTRMLRTTLRLGAALAMLGAAAACTPRIDTRGNLPDPDVLADVEVGHTNRDQVTQLLGSPSSIAAFDGESWYYISERTETLGFFAPEVKERKVVIIRFDDKGLVKAVNTLGLKDGRDIAQVERVTPTAGNEITFLQQLLGNIGRFEGAKDQGSTGGSGR